MKLQDRKSAFCRKQGIFHPQKPDHLQDIPGADPLGTKKPSISGLIDSSPAAKREAEAAKEAKEWEKKKKEKDKIKQQRFLYN